MQQFMRKFSFTPENHMMLGIERERFVVDQGGNICPKSSSILGNMMAVMVHERHRNRFGYELSACQLEDRIGPVPLDQVIQEMRLNDGTIENFSHEIGLATMFCEVAPDDMPLDVYPNERYLKLAATMDKATLQAACQVAGTHVHVGMANPEAALIAYNESVDHLDELLQEAASSGTNRLEIYKRVCPDPTPPKYASWEEFYQRACEKGFADNVRNCWDWIRISGKGTIEYRLFGATADHQKVYGWAKWCQEICQRALLATGGKV